MIITLNDKIELITIKSNFIPVSQQHIERVKALSGGVVDSIQCIIDEYKNNY